MVYMDIRLQLSRAFILTLVACGGTATIAVDPDAGGSSSGGSSSGGVSCTTQGQQGDQACVPGLAAAKTPIEIEVGSSTGCLGCFTQFEACEVTVSGQSIRVAMKSKTCAPPGDVACPAICQEIRTKCTIPPLAPGTYSVTVYGERFGGRRELEVSADGAGERNCSLLGNGERPKPIEGSGYDSTCSRDEDCVAIVAGDVCASDCACPSTSISEAALLAYQTDVRARRSQCGPFGPVPPCAACQAGKTFCAKSSADAKGVCKYQPPG